MWTGGQSVYGRKTPCQGAERVRGVRGKGGVSVGHRVVERGRGCRGPTSGRVETQGGVGGGRRVLEKDFVGVEDSPESWVCWLKFKETYSTFRTLLDWASRGRDRRGVPETCSARGRPKKGCTHPRKGGGSR